MNEPITVETHVMGTIEKVWHDFTSPEAITVWNTASDDWHTTRAENDLRVGGRFTSRMEAKDGSIGFDFSGIYDEVIPHERISYTMDDGRKVLVTFTPADNSVHVIESFDPEAENAHEFQRAGWQAILDSFKAYSESTT
jgi:uncharacterized protein YndB with AHSA1/START domain